MDQKKIQLFIFLGLTVFSLSFRMAEASEINQKNVADLVNYERIKSGMQALAENSRLNEAALAKAQDMIRHNYFAHTSPQDVSPWAWFEKSRYDYLYAGENLAINFQSAERQHEAWMESETHRKNILNPKYQEIGVATQRGVIDDKEALVTVQLFGAREDFQAVLGRTVPDEPSAGSSVAGLADIDDGRSADIFRVSGVLTLMLIMIVNPVLMAGLFLRGRKKLQETASIAYPVKIVLVK
jgi:hypothetical protein